MRAVFFVDERSQKSGNVVDMVCKAHEARLETVQNFEDQLWAPV